MQKFTRLLCDNKVRVGKQQHTMGTNLRKCRATKLQQPPNKQRCANFYFWKSIKGILLHLDVAYAAMECIKGKDN